MKVIVTPDEMTMAVINYFNLPQDSTVILNINDEKCPAEITMYTAEQESKEELKPKQKRKRRTKAEIQADEAEKAELNDSSAGSEISEISSKTTDVDSEQKVEEDLRRVDEEPELLVINEVTENISDNSIDSTDEPSIPELGDAGTEVWEVNTRTSSFFDDVQPLPSQQLFPEEPQVANIWEDVGSVDTTLTNPTPVGQPLF